MKFDIDKGINLLNDGNYEEAYNYFNQEAVENPKNVYARYFRAFIDFIHRREFLEQDYLDLKYAVSKRNKYYEHACSLLIYVSDLLNHNEDIIKYAPIVLEDSNENVSEIKAIYVRALLRTKEHQNVIKALKLIDDIIAEEEDATLNFYFMKVRILLDFKEFDEAETTVEKAFARFNPGVDLYYLRGLCSFALYKNKNVEDYLDDAINAFQIALQYDSKHNMSRIKLGEAYIIKNDVDNALETLDGFRVYYDENISPEDKISLEADIILEKVKILESAKEWDKAIAICEEYLKKYESWKVNYCLGYILNTIADTKEDLKKAVSYLYKAYNQNPDELTIAEIVLVNASLNNYEENDTLLKKGLEEDPDNGFLYFLLADNASHFLNDYDLILSYFEKAHNLGYMQDSDFYSTVLFLVKEPMAFYKKHHKKIIKKEINSVWDMRKMGIRYLYGDYGVKVDMKKAGFYLSKAYQLEPTEPCVLTIYGRFHEFTNFSDEAFRIYQEAYKNFSKSIHITCNCAIGYLAHAYIKGIGTNIDIDKAKELILEGINRDGIYSTSPVIYLYAYFSLLEEDGFDLNKALEYLSKNYCFDRYDIVRYLYVNKVLKKLGKEPKYSEDDIKLCLKNQAKEYSLYYKENKDLDVIYPCKKSF